MGEVLGVSDFSVCNSEMCEVRICGPSALEHAGGFQPQVSACLTGSMELWVNVTAHASSSRKAKMPTCKL